MSYPEDDLDHKESRMKDDASSEPETFPTIPQGLPARYDGLVNTTLMHILCTQLPKHWRSNKSLPTQFRVISLLPIPDGTRVWITAGNEERPHGELKNSTSFMHNQEAKFNDLRFLGRSGRGKSFNVSIHIDIDPQQIAVYMKAIKVTVDGPRVPRNKNGLLNRQERSKLNTILEMKQFSSKRENLIQLNRHALLKTRKRKYNLMVQGENLRTDWAPSSPLPTQIPQQNNENPFSKTPLNHIVQMLMKNIQAQSTNSIIPEEKNLPFPILRQGLPLLQKSLPPTPQNSFFQRLNEINRIAERILSPMLSDVNQKQSHTLNPQNITNILNSLRIDQQSTQSLEDQTNSSSPVTSNESPTIHESPKKVRANTWDSSNSSSKGFFVQNVLSSPASLSPETKNDEFYWDPTNPSKFDMAWQKA